MSGALGRFVGHGGANGGALVGGGGAGTAVAHGIAQGTVLVLRGQKFGSGFTSAFASHVTYGVTRIKRLGVAGRTAAAVIGGTVSKLVGGKFANGAISGAFVHLFNAEKSKKKTLADERQGQIDAMKERALRANLPENVKKAIRDNTFVYAESTVLITY